MSERCPTCESPKRGEPWCVHSVIPHKGDCVLCTDPWHSGISLAMMERCVFPQYPVPSTLVSPSGEASVSAPTTKEALCESTANTQCVSSGDPCCKVCGKPKFDPRTSTIASGSVGKLHEWYCTGLCGEVSAPTTPFVGMDLAVGPDRTVFFCTTCGPCDNPCPHLTVQPASEVSAPAPTPTNCSICGKDVNDKKSECTQYGHGVVASEVQPTDERAEQARQFKEARELVNSYEDRHKHLRGYYSRTDLLTVARLAARVLSGGTKS